MSVANSSTQFSRRHCAGRRVGGQATISALDLKEPRKARMKGYLAGAALTGTVLFFLSGWTILGLIGLGATGYLAYDWFRFRAKRGMRF